MHVLIAGSTGKTGIKIVEYLLEAGHDVTALVHNSPMHLEHSSLEIIKGDIEQPSTWDSFIFPGTVIISTLNAPKSDKDFLVRAAQLLTKAGESKGASRIMLLGGGGSLRMPDGSLSRDRPNYPEVFREVSAAHLKASHIVEKSRLGWTVFCPPDIKPGTRTKQYRIRATDKFEDTQWISVQDLADAFVDSVNKDTFLNTRVAITY